MNDIGRVYILFAVISESYGKTKAIGVFATKEKAEDAQKYFTMRTFIEEWDVEQ